MQNKSQLTVVKIGGKVLNNPEALNQLLQDFSSITGPKVIVHGGGSDATEMAKILGIEATLVNGRRITDAAMLDIVVMTYAGLLNKNIVAKLSALGNSVIGLTGADGNSILATKRVHPEIDFGFVGDVQQVNAPFIHNLLQQNCIPVFCAITHNENGQLLNTNADTIASEIAIALTKYYQVKLFYCFEKLGVLEDVENEETVIQNLNAQLYADLKQKNAIHSGMIPKLDNCFYALKNEVNEIQIGLPKALNNSNVKRTCIRL
ncbi:acetylglutamate kinase [Flavobacterium agricola]|uniref:Acetylglutamate kinase n=1 Tax=Flavobacterium agricola TaxID=2870839 RepID=A0ABY6M091_9FLAO|nr:acetylglutamate kinase [Flavobacterium agricola]UYW00293.1 acetylglutamate kinase [Flavobacterium agricola]